MGANPKDTSLPPSPEESYSPTLTSQDLYRMLAFSRAVCKQAGYHLRDQEVESAINYACFQAFTDWKEISGGRSPTSLASLYSLRACKHAVIQKKRWRRQDQLLADRQRKVQEDLHRTSLNSGQSSTDISEDQFTLLQFVAQHGRARAARLLEIDPAKLRELLDEIVAHIAR